MTMRFKKQAFVGKSAIAVYVNDYTKNMRRRLDRMRQQEEEQMRQQTENFTSTVSHEMRTPILSIIFFVKQMLEWLSQTPMSRTRVSQSFNYCTIMLSQLEFLQSFVNDLLDLAQLKNGAFSLVLERLNVFSVIEFIYTIF